MNDYSKVEPMYYWQPKETEENDIFNNPSKYDKYYIGSYKKDGEWSKVIWDGKEVKIVSRTISKKTGEYTHKEDNVPHLVEAFKKLPINTCIVGEMCYDELDKKSRDVGVILRCLPEKAIERQKDDKVKLHFYVFDILCYKDEDLMDKGFEERISYIEEVKRYLDSEYIRFACFKSVSEVVEEYVDYLSKGGEGFVLQRKDNKYTPGKRQPWKTIKLKKKTSELELPVVGFIEPIKEYTGKDIANWKYFNNDTPVTKYYYMGWKAGVEVINNGTVCRVASGVTDEDAEWLASNEAFELVKNHQLYAKVKCMEIEKDTNKMRHPKLIELRADVVKE